MNEIEITKVVPAAPDAVFRFWTEPEHVKQWWGPPGVTCTEAQVDLQVGGKYRIANLLPDGGTIWIHGEFELVEPPRKLKYTWALGLDRLPAETVTVTFTKVAFGTEVRVLHTKIPDPSMAEGHRDGWVGCLEGLAEFAARE